MFIKSAKIWTWIFSKADLSLWVGEQNYELGVDVAVEREEEDGTLLKNYRRLLQVVSKILERILQKHTYQSAHW